LIPFFLQWDNDLDLFKNSEVYVHNINKQRNIRTKKSFIGMALSIGIRFLLQGKDE